MFNVPSGVDTVKEGFFFQEQINLARSGESNLTASVGLLKGFEMGLNLFHVNLYGPGAEFARNMIMVNAIYTTDLTDWAALQIGGQLGFGRRLTDTSEVPVGWGYALTRVHSTVTDLAFVIGAYAGTESYLGHGWPAGPLAGIEYELIEEHLVLQADLLFGNHEAAVAVIGAVLLLPLGWQLALGIQLPSPLSHNAVGATLEITRVPPGVGEHPPDATWERDRMTQKWLREHQESQKTPVPPRIDKTPEPKPEPKPEPAPELKPEPGDAAPAPVSP